MTVHRSFRWLSRLLLAVILTLIILPPSASSAEVPAFRGEYYNTRDLTGARVLVRDDPAINFDWGGASPGPGINADNFSARWTNLVWFDAGTYRFTMRVDDGGRLWIDNALVLDYWVEQPSTAYIVDRTLAAGYYSIRMEYFEAGGGALAQLSWARADSHPTFPQWRGEYYPNVSLLGEPMLVRNDTDINFNWGYGAPAAEIPADNFSVRWTRDASFNAGDYTFTAISDDGIRVKVDNTWVINRWADQPETTTTGNIKLGAGTHKVVVEYYERTGAARAGLSWSQHTPPNTDTVVVVDDLDSGFTRGDTLANWGSRDYGYRNHLFWVWNNTTTAHYWGRWTPKLPAAGNYEVQVYIPRYYHGTTSARYRIIHNGTRHDKVISQARYYDQWVSLGTYYFQARGGEYVFLANNTGEPHASEHVGWDAVRFIGSGVTPSEPPPPPPPTQHCAIMPVLGFGQFWNSNAQVRDCLGCPTAPEAAIWMGEETFQGGKMFWRQDTGAIYVLFNDGHWLQFPDTWRAGEPEVDPNIVPPGGYYQPRRGFGRLWRSDPNVRERMGWSILVEHGFSGAIEPFEGGLMLWSPQLGIYALCNDGHWVRY